MAKRLVFIKCKTKLVTVTKFLTTSGKIWTSTSFAAHGKPTGFWARVYACGFEPFKKAVIACKN